MNALCKNIKHFNTITKCKIYSCTSKAKRNSFGTRISLEKTPKPKYKWVNTNKLLSKGYMGIKTGVTNTAGPWLAAYISKKKKSYLVILLNSRSMDARWVGKCFYLICIPFILLFIEVMKIVDHWQREQQISRIQRSQVNSIERKNYPLNQFKNKMSISEIRKGKNLYRINYDKESI